MPAWLVGIWGKVVFVAAFLGLLALAALKFIGIGRDKERYAATTKALQQSKEANDVENRVAGADSTELGKLRSKWTR